MISARPRSGTCPDPGHCGSPGSSMLRSPPTWVAVHGPLPCVLAASPRAQTQPRGGGTPRRAPSQLRGGRAPRHPRPRPDTSTRLRSSTGSVSPRAGAGHVARRAGALPSRSPGAQQARGRLTFPSAHPARAPAAAGARRPGPAGPPQLPRTPRSAPHARA